jgi:hypothetical protein
MMENEDAWRELVRTLDTHQQRFNEQLARLKAKDLEVDPNSALLGPIKQYSKLVPHDRLPFLKHTEIDPSFAERWRKYWQRS